MCGGGSEGIVFLLVGVCVCVDGIYILGTDRMVGIWIEDFRGKRTGIPNNWRM